MKLTINLATRRYLNLRRVNAGLALVFLALTLVLVFKVRELAENQAELAEIRKQSAATGAGRPQDEVSQAEITAQAARIRFANELIARKTVNWLSLLDRLEQVVPEGVALSGIEPDQRAQLLRITGAARSFANLRTFLENMEKSPHFSEVYLLAQADTKVGLTQRGLTFSVTCKVDYR